MTVLIIGYPDSGKSELAENMVMDMESGSMRFTTPWINAQEDEDD